MSEHDIKESLLKNTVIIGECWLYRGTPHNKFGHCKVRWSGKNVYIHRLSAHLHWGFDLNSPNLILHSIFCLPNCWNPEHLREGTHKDNAQDAILVGKFHYNNQVTTHCPQGHEYTPENTSINSNSGKKYCKECNRQRAAKYRELKHG